MTEFKISPLMQSINDEALHLARQKIGSRFVDPSDLEEISSLLELNQKELSLAESQLTVAVQGKLDALKRAADLMDDSSQKLSDLSTSIRKIDEKISLTNTVISNFDNLCRVHFVRDNLQKVVSQVEFFIRVPEKVQELRFILENEPTQLKEVYLEVIKYEALRTALMKEIKKSSRRFTQKKIQTQKQQQPTSARGGTRNRSTSEYSREDEKYIETTEIVNEHLSIVPELLQSVRDKLMENISKMSDMESTDPRILVMTFEIIELHKQYVMRRKQQLLSKSSSSTEEDKDDDDFELDLLDEEELNDKHGIFQDESITLTTLNKIKDTLKDMAYQRFKEASKTPFDDDGNPIMGGELEDEGSRVEFKLSSASQLIALMMEFKNEILPCIPPSYHIMDEFFEICEEYLKTTLYGLVGRGIDDLEVSDIMHIIDWVEYYKAQMRIFQCSDRPTVEEFSQIAEDVLNEYLERIKTQVFEWFGNIKNQPLEILRSDGRLLTSQPEDMFHVLHMQVSVAQERLPSELIRDVVNTCVQVLQSVRRESYDRFSSDWRKMNIEALVASINDNHRMQANCEEFKESVIPLYLDQHDKEIAIEMLEEVGNGYVQLAVSAVTYLVQSILIDLDEPVFSKLFTLEWETSTSNSSSNSSNESFSSIITATLEDYLPDIQSWLEPYYYPKFIKETLSLLIGSYAMSLRRHANGSFHFGNEMMVTRTILQDRNIFERFFLTLQEYFPIIPPSKISPIEIELELLTSLSLIIAATDPASKEKEIHLIFSHWGIDGLRLIQSILLSHPTLSKSDQSAQIDRVNRFFEEGKIKYKYSLELSELFKTQNDSSLQTAIANKVTATSGKPSNTKSTARRIFGF